jgi:basic membrane lipoprotein Med (substrate-binding protein (PBP1-ABC) superfamily)/DNA-binding SARP family transcriptional activator
MQFRILGALEAGADGTLAELGPPKQRALLAILLMHVGEIVPTDRLIDLLWGDRPPRTAAHSVQIYVSELRKSLEPLGAGRLIATRPPGYQLEAEPESIDARQFERLVDDGTRKIESGDREAGAAMVRSAIGLWRGPALSDFAYEEFAQPYIRRLHDLHLDAIEELAAAELASGRAAEVLPLLDAAIREDPLRERSRELVMLALYRSGRHAEALRTYEKLRALLDEELGLEPSPPVRRMQERILLHDPTLIATEVAPPPVEFRNPYKGLRPFAEDDAADFFGRDALLERLLDQLRKGSRLIALVGPSGSGKSSVLAAGLIPSLRAGVIPGSERWVLAPFVPGAHPLEQLEAVVAKVAGLPIGLAQLLDQRDTNGSPGPALRTMPDDGRLVLAIDQFEEVFSVADEQVRRRFLNALASAVTEPDGQVVVVLAMRADYYDRPLTYPSFADVFIPAVMNVLPMTKPELEAAVVSPAERVGVKVDPALLAELVAETADQSGALPLLQYALTELFEQRTVPSLTLTGYRSLGGLKGILSRRAESLYAALSPDEQRAAMQVFLRLVRLGHGTIDSRRRLLLSDLVDLDVDPVVLSEVLGAFGRHRLLSFDRDAVTGMATAEVAHEALLREWDRLAGWIDRHRTALRRHETFAAAVDEWEASGRHNDYLLTGGRLSEFEAWRTEGTLHLTGREREFLEAGLARRSQEQREEAARSDANRRLEGRARIRLVALTIAIALLGAAVAYGVWATGNGHVPSVALLQSGVSALNDLNEDGFDRAVSDFGLAGKERLYDQTEGVGDDLRGLAADGSELIIVSGAVLDDLGPVVRDYPGTRFVMGEEIDAPNVSTIAFAWKDGSFLAGAVAAATSMNNTVGFIGGLDAPLLWRFQAGFEAGARRLDPDVHVLSTYLAHPPDFERAFSDPRSANEAARTMYDAGADVIFHAAGGSGIGVFEAATELSGPGRQLWVVGVDSDQFETVRLLTGVVDPEAWRQHILTSVVLRQDLAIYAVLEDFARGEFRPGVRTFDLASDGVGVSYSGGFIAHLRPMIDALTAEIIAGAIDVPCVPADRVDEAVNLGLAVTGCAG